MTIFLNMLPMFLLVFCRITAFFVVAPIFSAKSVPAQFKIGFCAFLSLIIVSTKLSDWPVMAVDGLYMIEVIKEVMIGLLLGFVAYMVFTTFELAGGLIDMQMGLSMATVLDPVSGTSTPLTGHFKYVIATLLFLSYNGHHLLIQATVQSYDLIPIGSDFYAKVANGSVSTFLLTTFTTVFVLALQMAAPVIVALFLTDLGLGILAKVAPQFNVFVVGMPIKLLVGLFILAAVIPSFGFLFGELFKNLFASLNQMLEILSKP